MVENLENILGASMLAVCLTILAWGQPVKGLVCRSASHEKSTKRYNRKITHLRTFISDYVVVGMNVFALVPGAISPTNATAVDDVRSQNPPSAPS